VKFVKICDILIRKLLFIINDVLCTNQLYQFYAYLVQLKVTLNSAVNLSGFTPKWFHDMSIIIILNFEPNKLCYISHSAQC